MSSVTICNTFFPSFEELRAAISNKPHYAVLTASVASLSGGIMIVGLCQTCEFEQIDLPNLQNRQLATAITLFGIGVGGITSVMAHIFFKSILSQNTSTSQNTPV